MAGWFATDKEITLSLSVAIAAQLTRESLNQGRILMVDRVASGSPMLFKACAIKLGVVGFGYRYFR